MSIRSVQLVRIIPVAAAFLAVAAIIWWLFTDPTPDFTPSEPGRDDYVTAGSDGDDVVIGEHFKRFSETQPYLSERWPRFRGVLSDNHYRSARQLKSSFGNRKPEFLWSVQLGEGHAGAAIYDGMVYVLDYDEEIRADMLRCFSLTTGEEIWRRWYHVQIRRNHGMSRTVPAVTENFILTMGPRGHVMCVDRITGDLLWGIDMEKEYESEIPLWYTGQCPIIEDDVAVIAPGGKALLIGVDCATGNIIWQTPNSNNLPMAHSSVMPYVFAGRKMFVYSTSGAAVGIAADGSDAGKVLWQTTEWNHPVVAPSPVCMPDGKIFLSAGYGAGGMLLQLSERGGNFSVNVLNTISPGDGLSSEQQTPVLVDGHLFGIMPKDAKSLRNQFVCVKADDPTAVVWSSGPGNRFGLGPYILAGTLFYLLNDDATLVIVRKSTKEYIEIDRIRLFDGFDAWAPLAIANGYMVLRDSERMICIDLNK